MHWIMLVYFMNWRGQQVLRADVGTESACDFQARQVSGGYAPGRIVKLDPDAPFTHDDDGLFLWKCLPVDANGDDARPGHATRKPEPPSFRSREVPG